MLNQITKFARRLLADPVLLRPVTVNEVASTELTILSIDRLLLARVDLAGTTWELGRGPGRLFTNTVDVYTPVLATGTVGYGYIGGKPKTIDTDLIGRKCCRGETICFHRGGLTIGTLSDWPDDVGSESDRRRLEVESKGLSIMTDDSSRRRRNP